MTEKIELKDEDLNKVSGGAKVDLNLSTGTIIVDMAKGEGTINDLYDQYSNIVSSIGGESAIVVCNDIKNSLNKHSNITRCEININTLEPIYYVGNKKYTQAEVNGWK